MTGVQTCALPISFLALPAFPYVLPPYFTVMAFCNASSTVLPSAATVCFSTSADVADCESLTVNEVVRTTSFPSTFTIAFTEYVPTASFFSSAVMAPPLTVLFSPTAAILIAEPLVVVVTCLPSLSFTSHESAFTSLASTPLFVPITLSTTSLAALLSLSTFKSTLLTSILQPFTLVVSAFFTTTETVLATTSLPSFLYEILYT